jgi:polyhydroxyalkanoate synthase
MTQKPVPAVDALGQAAQAAQATQAQVQANAQAIGNAMTDMWKTMSGLSLPMDAMAKLQGDYISHQKARRCTCWWRRQRTHPAADGRKRCRATPRPRPSIRFAVQQWVDAASAEQLPGHNPEALAKAIETKGESITQGMQLLWKDIEQGHMSQTDESVFEVGRNVATTKARWCSRTSCSS